MSNFNQKLVSKFSAAIHVPLTIRYFPMIDTQIYYRIIYFWFIAMDVN